MRGRRKEKAVAPETVVPASKAAVPEPGAAGVAGEAAASAEAPLATRGRGAPVSPAAAPVQAPVAAPESAAPVSPAAARIARAEEMVAATCRAIDEVLDELG